MWTRFLFGLLFVVHANSLSVIPDEKQRTTVTDEGTIKSSAKNVETLKQLVNQETIIRMSLERKVYNLLRDMADLKTKMESKNKQLEEEVRALRHENILMRADYGDQSNVTTLHSSKILELTSDVSTLESKNKQLQQDVRALRHGYGDQSNVTTLHSGKLLELSSAVSTLEAFSKNISSASRSAEKVAFTATVTQKMTSQNGQTLVFPHVITNIGGGYNNNSGVFTAPRDGVYVFFCKITSRDNPSDMYFGFILNGSAKTGNLVYGRSDHPYRTSSNSIVLQLRQGDRVWVQMYLGGKHYYWGVGGDQLFSGYLL